MMENGKQRKRRQLTPEKKCEVFLEYDDSWGFCRRGRRPQ